MLGMQRITLRIHNQFQWAKEIIPKLKLQGKEDLFDIGCGDEKINAEIPKCLSNGKAFSKDSSNQMTKLALSLP